MLHMKKYKFMNLFRSRYLGQLVIPFSHVTLTNRHMLSSWTRVEKTLYNLGLHP